jgi:hypothetical protein
MNAATNEMPPHWQQAAAGVSELIRAGMQQAQEAREAQVASGRCLAMLNGNRGYCTRPPTITVRAYGFCAQHAKTHR